MTDPHNPPSVRDVEEPKLEAIIELMFLAAFADGDFGDEERDQCIRSIETLTDRRMARATLERLMTRITVDLENEGRALRLASVRERITDEESRKIALDLAIQLTAADGIIRTSERELILEAAEALEIDQDEAADMVSRQAC
jgi:tellurite resistance protein